MNKRFLLLVFLFVAALIYFGYLVPARHGVQPGVQAPDFELPSSNSEMVSLANFRGQTVLVNFWATWCPPCVWEMPSLERLSQILRDDKFRVVAVSLDEEGWGPIEEFQKQVAVTFPILLDRPGQVADLYETYQLPESYLIFPNGVVGKKYIGPRTWDDSSTIAEIKRLMAEYRQGS